MKKRIMVVDDSRSILKSIKLLLESENFEVMPVLSGKECLSKLKKGKKPDLILLDILMPGMDGWKTLREIRKINRNQKVIFLTVVNAPLHIKEDLAERWGAVDYITKPFDNKELLKRVKRAVGD